MCPALSSVDVGWIIPEYCIDGITDKTAVANMAATCDFVTDETSKPKAVAAQT
jgi:hypothetical protein